MNYEQEIGGTKTRIVLLLILATLLLQNNYDFWAYFVLGWTTMGFIGLVIKVTREQKSWNR